MKTSASFLASDLNANPHPLEIVRGAAEKDIEQELQKRISERAYELYQSSDRSSGHELEHWGQAEKEILKRVMQVRESGSWVIVNLHVPNVPAEGFKLLINENKALVEVEEPSWRGKAGQQHSSAVSYYLTEWPGCVDPATASAYVKNGTLTLEVKLTTPKPNAVKKATTRG